MWFHHTGENCPRKRNRHQRTYFGPIPCLPYKISRTLGFSDQMSVYAYILTGQMPIPLALCPLLSPSFPPKALSLSLRLPQ